MFLVLRGKTGETAKIDIEEVIRKFSKSIAFDVTAAGIMLEKKDSSVCAWSDDLHEEESDYPGIWVTGTCSESNLDISRTELPNEDNASMTAYLYAGKCDQETDEWLVSIHDGQRNPGDESRRLVVIDEKLACAISAKETSSDIPVITEQQAKESNLGLLF